MNRREFVVLAAGAPLTLRRDSGRADARGARHLRLRGAARGRRPRVVQRRRHLATLPDPRAIELVGSRRRRVPHRRRRRLDRRAATASGTCCAGSRSRGTRPRTPTAATRSSPTRAEAASSRSTSSGSGRSAASLCRAGRATSRSTRPAGRLWVGLGSAAPHVAVVDTTAIAPRRHVDARLRRPRRRSRSRRPALGDRRRRRGSSRSRAPFTPPTRARSTSPSGTGRAYVTSGAAGVLRVQTLAGRVLRSTPIPSARTTSSTARGA